MAFLKRKIKRVSKSKSEFPKVDRAVVPPTRATAAAIFSDMPRRGSSSSTKVEKIAISNVCPKPAQSAAVHKPIVSVQFEEPLNTTVIEQEERKPVRPPFVIFKDFNVPELIAQAASERVIACEQQRLALRSGGSSEEAMQQEVIEPQMVERDLDISVEAEQSRSVDHSAVSDAKKVVLAVPEPARAVDVADKENFALPQCIAEVKCVAASEQQQSSGAFEDTLKKPVRRQVHFDSAIPQERRCILEAVPMPLGQPLALSQVQFTSARKHQPEQPEVADDPMEVDEVANEHLPQLEQQHDAVKHVRFAACTAIVALDMSQEAVDYRRNEPDETYEACHFSARAILSRDRRFYNDARHAERALQCALERAMQNRKLNSSARFAFVVNGRARVLDYLCGV